MTCIRKGRGTSAALCQANRQLYLATTTGAHPGAQNRGWITGVIHRDKDHVRGGNWNDQSAAVGFNLDMHAHGSGADASDTAVAGNYVVDVNRMLEFDPIHETSYAAVDVGISADSLGHIRTSKVHMAQEDATEDIAHTVGLKG